MRRGFFFWKAGKYAQNPIEIRDSVWYTGCRMALGERRVQTGPDDEEIEPMRGLFERAGLSTDSYQAVR